MVTERCFLLHIIWTLLNFFACFQLDNIFFYAFLYFFFLSTADFPLPVKPHPSYWLFAWPSTYIDFSQFSIHFVFNSLGVRIACLFRVGAVLLKSINICYRHSCGLWAFGWVVDTFYLILFAMHSTFYTLFLCSHINHYSCTFTTSFSWCAIPLLIQREELLPNLEVPGNSHLLTCSPKMSWSRRVFFATYQAPKMSFQQTAIGWRAQFLVIEM